MKFEFIVAYRQLPGFDMAESLKTALATALEDNAEEENESSYFNDVADRVLTQQYQRAGEENSGDTGESSQYFQLGFNIDLPEDGDNEEIISDFSSSIKAITEVGQLVCFESPLLQKDLTRWGEEIFLLEMKLRRVLSWIYLHAYQNDNPYDLLREEVVQPMAKEKVVPEQMRAVSENQFFHLTFSNYVELNKRPEIKMGSTIEYIRIHEEYERFRNEILRKPIEDTDDMELLLRIKERLNSIEAMRNCVAHNRHPSKKIKDNYEAASPIIHQALDEYLARWTIE